MSFIKIYRWTLLIVGAVALLSVACANQAGNQAVPSPKPTAEHAQKQEMDIKLEVPSSIAAEHKELHEQLEAAVKAGGKTGEAAKVVEERLKVHFEQEEEFALPQLSILSHLAMGHTPRDTKKAIELSDKLKAEMPKMLEEHKGIVAALDALAVAAKDENKPQAIEFAEKLKAHAMNEEQIMYPAAILVGEYLKLRP